MKNQKNCSKDDFRIDSRKLAAYLDRPDFGAVADDDYRQVFVPFSYFGGKRLNVEPVWERFGSDVPNYIEPFCGGAAIFFGRPPNSGGGRRRELINDEYCQLINAYRTIKYGDPAAIAEISAEPYFEDDLIAWNRHLISNRFVLRKAIRKNVRYYDPELGARWIWLNRGWIGAGACDPGTNVDSKMIQAHIAAWYRNSAEELYRRLKTRLTDTQIFNGGYVRAIKSRTQTTKFKVTAIFIDPPYSTDYCSRSYDYQSTTVAWEAFEKALELGINPQFRIAYCGYMSIFGERFAAAGWEAVKCRTLGGFGNQGKPGRGRRNSRDEYIWFSPYCLKP